MTAEESIHHSNWNFVQETKFSGYSSSLSGHGPSIGSCSQSYSLLEATSEHVAGVHGNIASNLNTPGTRLDILSLGRVH